MPGFRGAERVEIKTGEARSFEAKEIEGKVQPFLQRTSPADKPILTVSSEGNTGVNSFIAIGETGVGVDPQFRSRHDLEPLRWNAPNFFPNELGPKRDLPKSISREASLKRMAASPELVAVAAGLTVFFGFVGEAFGGPATEFFLKGKESPVKMKEGVPDVGKSGEIPRPKDSMGSAESWMIVSLVAAIALPFVVGKARRAWRTHRAEKLAKIQESLTEDFAASLHESWRKTRNKTETGYEPMFLETKDPKWIEAHPEASVEIREGMRFAKFDIANMEFKDLPAEGRKEDRGNADAALGEVFKALIAGKKLNRPFIKATSQLVYENWLERNVSEADSKSATSFKKLPKAEKEKYRSVVREAIKFYKKS